MSKINIPERLATRMSHEDKGRTWLAPVLQFKANIESILAKDPDFFPDYTLHGVPHLNRVLELASQLISTDTLSADPHPDKKDLLAPRDVAFLVCGILLHDMGMYLRPDGLKKLIKQEKTEDAFGGKLWNQEWSEYVDRTKRLSQEKMRYHFGRVIPVTEDCVDHAGTDDNKRIIGEFLRQHHARLAHEFAIGVLPGSTDTDLFANTIFDEDDRMMIGLLARSHGMAIRDTEEYLKTKFDNTVKPYNLPVFYLMAVLRIADYLDADGQRAPKQLTQQQKISVPLSAEEWTWNQCIKAYATHFDFVPKNYYVSAKPKTSPQYVQLEKWLKSVQTDLDLCWSILAEKYPDDKNRYRLSIHRVVSNIHQPDHVKELNNTFLTKEAKITANPEIVKLMMEPLYGDDPTYGVRELLQNAVDACLEREKWEKDHGNPNYKGRVDIRIDNDIFTITDNGMGMNEDVLLNYYLSAGSSYRSSDAWMAANAPDGKSQVARTGRFGVGFLASFLLGDTVEVHTQHVLNREKGYQFSFDKDSKPLDIKRERRNTPDDPFGTTITIQLHKDAHRGFHPINYNYPWHNWYAFDEPKVRYFMNGTELAYEGPQLHRDPDQNKSWLTLPSNKFETVQWMPNWENHNSRFYCNGIRIYSSPIYMGKPGIPYSTPHISVIDKNGQLTVDLARQKIKHFPDYDSLIHEMLHWQIAYLLLVPWDNEDCFLTNCTRGFNWVADPTLTTPFLLSQYGFSLNYASVIPILNVEDYVFLYYNGKHMYSAITASMDFLPKDTPHCIVTADWGTPKKLITDLFGKYNGRTFSRHALGYDIENFCATTWVREDVQTMISNRQRDDMNLTKFVSDGDICISCSIYRPSKMPIDLQKFSSDDFPVAVHVLAQSNGITFRNAGNSPFTQLLTELLIPAPDYPEQNFWIPYNMEERRKKFPDAFKKLAVYMDHIRNNPFD